jgi:hypothetical protein
VASAGGVDQANDPGHFEWLEDTQVRTVGAGAAFDGCTELPSRDLVNKDWYRGLKMAELHCEIRVYPHVPQSASGSRWTTHISRILLSVSRLQWA